MNRLRIDHRRRITFNTLYFARVAVVEPLVMASIDKSSPAIQVENLHKTYSEGLLFKRQVEALRGVSLTVDRGTIYGLLGPNGAGKTTLIKVLLGIVRKSSGKAKLLGCEAGDLHGRQGVGYLPESHRIPRHHTANSALEYYGALSGLSVREIRRRRPELLKTVGLENWGKTPVREFSKGMQQRLGLAQAMLHDPELLMLDEPTDGVDPAGRRDMRLTLRKLKEQGKTIFINSHLLQEIELVCDRVAILANGQLRREGLVESIRQGNDPQYELTIIGDEGPIRSALSRWKIVNWRALGSRQFKVDFTMKNQTEVDSCIDALRAAHVSVVELARHRDSLEDAFMQVIGKRESTPSSPFIE